MDFTLLEEAFIDPRQRINTEPKQDKNVIPETVQEVPELQQPIIHAPNLIESESNETTYLGLSCCSCKKINWFNVAVIALLLYIILKKN